MASEAFYVPFDKITPLPTPAGPSAIYIWQAFPWMKYFITPWERNFTGVGHMQEWWRTYPWLPMVLCGCYLVMCYVGPKMMAGFKPFDLRGPLAYWNLFLSVFSWIGAFRTVPYLFYWLSTIGFKELTCRDPMETHGEREIGLWISLFALSKAFEFFDTAFIILRKKPLIFLHWYHHFTVALYCYYASILSNGGLIFAAMNYSVHAVMYGYFYLMAIKRVPKWFSPMWITGFQISQMFIGIFVAVKHAMWTFEGTCYNGNKYMSAGALTMYGSYAYLFIAFFVDRFVMEPRRKRKQRREAANGQGLSNGSLTRETTAEGVVSDAATAKKAQ